MKMREIVNPVLNTISRVFSQGTKKYIYILGDDQRELFL